MRGSSEVEQWTHIPQVGDSISPLAPKLHGVLLFCDIKQRLGGRRQVPATWGLGIPRHKVPRCVATHPYGHWQQCSFEYVVQTGR